MPLTRLDNLISSKTGKYLYVSPDDFNATDALDNRGNSPLRPFVTIQRAFLEAARFSYLPNVDNDRFDQFTIMLAPGNHYIDNRPGIEDVSSLPIFQFNQATQEWESNTNVSFDLSDPDNILYKFNGRDGGATIPRGTSLVGTDLRRTQVRALYVPDPADKDIPRTALFNVTGGCYFWQFTILDGDTESGSPLYNVGSPVGIGKVYTQPNDNVNLAIPEFSHHKITNFVFADREDLGLLYRKIARVFSDYQPAIDDVYVEGSNTPVTDSWSSTVAYQIGDRVIYDGNAYIASNVSTNIAPDSDDTKWSRLVIRGREFDFRVQENRIVGPLSDAVRLDEVTIIDSNPPGTVTVRVRTKINHGFFPGQFVAITNNGLNTTLNGVFRVTSISQTDPKEFEYKVNTTATGLGLISGTTYTAVSSPALDTNATVQAEVDSVESASPYVFNVSIRSTWGICGIWADGRKATGFKSMVIAQYTGVSLQKDDRAFIRYDEFSNTWNQAPLTDAFATTPYHIKGDAYWKDDWRNFHVRASDDSFIQNVSIFAVGFADHFLLESGGDMSITNSNSNFGNTSMHSKGYKGFAFSQDKGGYITHIVPPKSLSTLKTIKQQYYVLDAQLTRASANVNRLYFGSDDAKSPEDRPAASISGYRIGARRNEKLYVKLDTSGAKKAELFPSGFKKWVSSLSTISPTGSRSVEDATRLYVTSTTGFALNDYVKVDNEFFRITTVNPTSFNVVRSQLGSTSSDHINGSTVTKYVQNSIATTILNETVDATETVLDVQDTTGLTPNVFASITNSLTSINETVRIVSVENSQQIVVQRGQLGTVAVAQPVSSLVTLTTLANTYSPAIPAVTTTITERYPRITPASNASERDFNLAQDAANLIDSNKTFIQAEAFGYILEKYPYLQNISYVNPNITSETGRYRDASNLIQANRQEIIDYAFGQMQVAFPSFVVPGNDNEKCKRDIGYIVDAIASDLYNGGNAHIIEATKAYFDNNGALITNGVLGEQTQSVFAFNRARDWAKKAISNLLTNTSLLDVISITSSGTTVTVTTGDPHNLQAGDKVTVGGSTNTQYNGKVTVLGAGLTATQFRYTAATAPTVSPATGAYYVSTVTIDPVNDSATAGRYKDASNLIKSNRQEIIDRAAAQVAVDYPDFYYPGDPQTTATSRFKDSYRLIQQNRQEIIDRAAAEIAVQHPDFYYPGDAQTTSTSRYKDAYRLIQLNRAEIISGAFAQIAISYPGFTNPNPTKCQRDIGFFIDAVSLDISIGSGNVYSRKFVQQYFAGNTPITNGLVGEEQQSITAFNKARDLMRSAVANQLTVKDLTVTPDPVTGSNTNVNSCSNVQLAISNLTTIITDVINAGDITILSPENVGTVPSGESKCKRDISLFIDAVSLDIAQGGGNVYSRKFIQNYFNSAGTSWISNGLQGEEAQSVTAFNMARDMMKKAITNQLYTKDLTISAGPATYGGGGGNISVDPSGNAASCADVQQAINNLTTIITDRVTAGNLTGLPSQTTATIPSGEAKCKRDIGYILDSVAQDLYWGGNEFTVGAVREYFDLSGAPINNGLINEETQTVVAFNAAREAAKKAVTNQLYAKNLNLSYGPQNAGGSGGNISYNGSGNGATCVDVQNTITSLFAIATSVVSSGSLAALPPVNNGAYDCANVRNTIDTLTSIITTSLTSASISQLPAVNLGPWSQVSENSKCKRDIGYIVEAVTSDLRLGGNENTINAAEAYYTAIPLNTDTVDGRQDGFTLDYIENERPETLDAYNYVRNLAISAMRNHNTYINNATTTLNSPIVTVPSTVGLAIGMRVRSVNAIPSSPGDTVTFTGTIPSNAYIKKIGDGQNGLSSNQIELGREGTKFDTGETVSATVSSTTVKLYVELTEGIWANTVEPSTDSAVIQDYNYLAAGDPSTGAPGGECASVANSLVNYFNIISTIINNGVGTVPRVASSLNTASLAQRGTLFTLTENDSNGNPTTNPHQLETGTPVRLVPTARPGTNPDKRVIRLPRGFDTNTIYYVIAPGRRTDPFDYSNSIGFNGANQQTLMLATSEENAAAGIYIYSSETDSVDPDVNIDVYQYVLDVKYDLHQYETKIAQNSSTEFETTRPHIFDKPADGVDPQLVFFRVGSDIIGSSLPTLSSSFGGTVISEKQQYYVRYVSARRFTVHQTFADARDNINPVTFQPGSTAVFYTFASKRRSPLKYDPVVNGANEGCWYLNSLTDGNEIVPRVKLSDYAGRVRTTDTYFERIEDNRTPEDRVYRIRYVIPKNLKTVRDPLRGFVFKIRSDEKRRLLPQRILLKPTAAGSSLATINAPLTGERLGLTKSEQETLNPNFVSTYDPGPQGNPKRVETDSKIAFTIQSARKKKIGNLDYLQLTVFDIGVDAEAFKTKLFTTVKISAPEGGDGSFVESIPNSNLTNKITWDGNSKGTAYVHAYFAYENDYYMILKDFTGNSEIKFDVNVPTTFTQGSVTATLLDAANGGRSDIANNLYVVEGANVYTMTPGDTINDDQGVSYTIAEVEDVSEMESTFYIFDIDTIRRRIAGQQDGVYYLTCLRGDIRPFPTGSGVGENFRNFRFSQPVSKLYPEFYKNDPEWYKGIDPSTATLLDPPPTVSAADNYVHGLVTVNDSKGSVSRELVLDFVADPGTGNYTYTGNNTIQAQPGSASAGSEGRLIPISGDSPYPTEGKLYVELRRPSIARSGNHTFEYLGFGPGNYSTGFPARQEVVLTDVQDFYAQAKREDAGIVFYTGLNSNGDLYIGNRKINAITGEETFLERAELVESEDEGDSIGNLVTTFDTPVTFNEIITVNGGGGGDESFFNSPVVINNATSFGTVENYPSLKIVTGEGTPVGFDQYLEFNTVGQRTGDIIIHQNRISAAIFDFNPRGTQDYTIRTALSNITPDLNNTFASTTGLASQITNTNFGTRDPLKSGDMLLKGDQTSFTGSLGWIYANDYVKLENRSDGATTPQVVGIQGNATGTFARIYWNTGINNTSLSINSSTQIRITGATSTIAIANGVWNIVPGSFNGANNYIDIILNSNLSVYPVNLNNGKGWPVDQIAQPNIVISRSQSSFKEWGVLGSESIRTETATIGDYKLGINTVARSPHSAYLTGFVDAATTTPRANLDVVGTAFISGKKINSYLTEITSTKTETAVDTAFMVGGNSLSLNGPATFRVMTTNNGRVGINTSLVDAVNPSNVLDRNFVVVGNARVTSDFELTGDLQVNGGDLTTTAPSFNLLNTSAPDILNFAGGSEVFNIGHVTGGDQTINIGNNASSSYIQIGNVASESVLRIHRNSLNAIVDIASVADTVGNSCEVQIGGAWSNTSSFTEIRTRNTLIAGELEFGTRYAAGTSQSRIFTQTRVLNAFDGDQTNTVNLATNATTFNLGSLGGNTTIRNTLNVLASNNVNGNIKLNGGLNAGIVQIVRGRFSTPVVAHNLGSLANTNIDYYQYNTTGRVIDTQGVAQWGGTSFLVAGGQIAGIDTIINTGGANRNSGIYSFIPASGGTGTGASFTISIANDKTLAIDIVSPGSGYTDNDLLTITASQIGGGTGAGNLTFQVNGINAGGSSYYLPISTPGVFDFRVGDLILIDRGDAATPDSVVVSGGGSITGLRNQANSEIVRVTGLTNLSNPNDPEGFRVQVIRGQEGTQTRTDHPQGCVLAKLIKQTNASYITGSDLDGNGVLDLPLTGISNSNANVNIGVAEFGGVLTTRDFLRLSGSEIVGIASTVSTDIQVLEVNDGSITPATVFRVESTTGNTTIGGNLGVGTGFNRFTVAGSSGNTNIAGTLTTENTLTINGSTIENTQFFTITNGGATGVPLRTTFQIDTANGNVRMNGGNINIYGTDGTTPRLTFNNSSGDFTTYGSFSALGTGPSTFGGDIVAAGDLTLNGGDITVNSGGNTIFEVNNNGSMRIAGINNYFTQTGGRRWEYVDGFVVSALPNVNYFVNATQNTLFKLPANPLIGDMIRVIDIGGNLNYNLSLIIRAPDNVKVQNASDNTARNIASGIPVSDFAGYNGGEMVVQTPYAAFGLVFAGSATPDGNTAVPSSIAGWYLIEV